MSNAPLNALLTILAAMLVGAVLGILAVSVGTSYIADRVPAKVDQPLIVYGER